MSHKNALYTGLIAVGAIVFYHKYGSKLGMPARHGS